MSAKSAGLKCVALPLLALLLASACNSDASSPGGEQPLAFGAADEAALITTVRTLTSPELNGRLTGSDGAQRAAAAIVEALDNCPSIEPVMGQSFRAEASTDSLPVDWPTPEKHRLCLL